MHPPELSDYTALFARYGKLSDIYMGPDDERFRLLFEQVCHLLSQPSPFNLSLPDGFVRTARQYLANDSRTPIKILTHVHGHSYPCT
jgi:hypothetical protein